MGDSYEFKCSVKTQELCTRSESWFYYLYELETNDLTSLSLYEMGLMINNKDVAQSLTPQ